MPHPRLDMRWATLPAVSAALAVALSLAGFPAAFLLGPMLAAIVFGACGARLSVPKPMFLAAQAAIGCLVAQAVTADFLLTLIEDGVLIMLVVSVTIVAGALAGIVLTCLRVLPGSTAAWGSAPSGAAAMVALSEAHGSDPRLAAFMQYVRVAAVVLSASLIARTLGDDNALQNVAAPPFAPGFVLATLAVAAAGAGIALTLRLPSGALIGLMLLGVALHAAGVVEMPLPGPILDAAYAGLGWYVGLRFSRETLRTCWHALHGLLAATISMIGLCGLVAFGLTFLLPIDFLTASLATSPGGLDSVAVIAVGTQADMAFVLSVQTLRLLVVLLTGPIIAQFAAEGPEP